MRIDAHLHCSGHEPAGDNGVLPAPFLSDGHSLHEAASRRRADEHPARVALHDAA